MHADQEDMIRVEGEQRGHKVRGGEGRSQWGRYMSNIDREVQSPFVGLDLHSKYFWRATNFCGDFLR